MDKNRWHEIELIVDQALSIDNLQERTAFLSDRLANDEGLKREVTSLLDSIEASQGLWKDLLTSNEKLVADMTNNDAIGLPSARVFLPDQIGPYRIKQLLGRGGMGDVYLAERINSDFHQHVALKVLQREVQNDEANQRFIQERKILSTLNHPNIAGLLDGGISEGGRPFFVMEYIDGIPITEYVKKNDCSIEERLLLFQQVCEAVQYAHTNFIVHRDLKPDNILVTSDKQIKILDFGIAKMLDQKLTDQTLLKTRAGQRILSINYAAPEQITMGPITTATDVYALGLLLYEILTDTKAFKLGDKRLIEAEQIIRQKDPLKPSLANESWKKSLQGDLDSIILKALRKEPGQRYELASRLLEDLQRYRNNKPVDARKGNFRYRSGKFIKRNKVTIGAASILVTTILIISVFYAFRINQEKAIANEEAEKAAQISQFLIELFEGANPYSKASVTGINTRIGTLLEVGVNRLNTKLENQPEVKASLQNVIGQVYFRLGEFSEAESLLDKAINTADESGIDITKASGLYNLALVYQETGNIEQADSLLKHSLMLFEKSEQGYTHEDALAALSLYGNLAWFNKGDIAKADSLLTKRLELTRKYFAEQPGQLATAYNDLATLNHSQGKFNQAIPYYRDAIEIYENSNDNEANLAIVLSNFSILLRENGNLDEAEAMQLRALVITSKNEEQYPIDIALGTGNLGEINLLKGNLSVADSLSRLSISKLISIYGDVHPYIARTKLTLGRTYHQQQRFDKAKELLNEANREYQRAYPDGHPRLSDPIQELGKVYLSTGNIDSALIHLKKAYESKVKSYPPDSWRLADAMSAYGDALSHSNRYQEADSLLETSFHILREQFGEDDQRTRLARQRIKHHEKRID